MAEWPPDEPSMTNHHLTRRDLLIAGTAAAGHAFLSEARAADGSEHHGISAFGDLKYPPEFRQLDYVNPKAHKGGVFSHIGSRAIFNQNILTFNSLNSFILKGDAAQGMELTFASLMARALDEPDALYGLAARAVQTSSDGLTYRFLLRDGLRFNDGTPLTAEDVVFSLNILKSKGHPLAQLLLREFKDAHAENDATVAVRFVENRGRDAPLFVAVLPIFSRRYYSSRPFDETSLEAPLGSGPYKVGRFEVGRFIEYERVKDWWGADLPVGRGHNNFDVIRYEFYRDRDLAFQGFTAKSYLFREEFTSRIWATGYDFPAVRDGRVKRDVLPDDGPTGIQGWFFNTRREAFKDSRVREAFIYAFDFEWTNKTIMYDAYRRLHSVFQNTDMMAVGKPGPDELALLEPFRGKVSDEVFGEPFSPPVSDGSGQDRALLRKAGALLQQAGCTITDGKRSTPQGKPLTVEFLIDEPSVQAQHMPFIKNLGLLGIEATLRIVDPIQFRARVDEFDFDITVQRFGFSTLPGALLRAYFSSQAVGVKGSQNLAGISDPVIDALIDRIVAADTRRSLVTACKVLDRVVRNGRYWIPHWYKGAHWLAYWDVFDRPATKPRYARGAPDTWWYDQQKAAQLERRG
jgi:microcin C transport system substrate-binding protein